jgi:NAD(P)-dependent dehydrogenase (short-subunit alcohol dehydrogenase family)
MNISQEELDICLNVLQRISDNPSAIVDNQDIQFLIGKIYQVCQFNEENNITAKERRARSNEGVEKGNIVESANIQQREIQLVNKSNQSIKCYVCKARFTELHFFYNQLCPKCGDVNYQKRYQRTNLNGYVALVTGGRIKIGYQTALRMLRDGARVIVTTRFPQDCDRRFSAEADFRQWRDRLSIYGLDLRNILAVENFVNHLINRESTLDIIVNNAAQTIKRPQEFYKQLLAGEELLSGQEKPLENLLQNIPNQGTELIASEEFKGKFLLETSLDTESHLQSQIYEQKLLSAGIDKEIETNYFPANTFDEEGQPLDMRPINSWVLKLNEVSTLEMLEVQLINNIAPFILNSKLKVLMERSPHPRKFIINVSAMEGQFNRKRKTPYHPHTNMAKAALNMMTRTSATEYVRSGIYMNSVDTGWITNENPYPKKIHMQEKYGFQPPLDVIDGMARIYDPIVQGLEKPETPVYGKFLKDYFPHSW